MGRKLRVEYPNGIYHIMQRGNNKSDIINNDIQKKYLLRIIKESKEKFDFKLLAYVIMDNHYHLLVQRRNDNIQDAMHIINSNYSKYYNYKVNHIGHVFQGRYQSLWVKDQSYLFTLVRYIHQNPVVANMCKKTEQYKWSSDRFYRSNLTKQFVDIDTVLETLSIKRTIANKRYRQLVDQTITKKELNITDDDLKDMDILENKTSLTELKFKYLANESTFKNNEAKIRFIKDAKRLGFTLNEIGNTLKLSKSTICRIIQNNN